MNISRDFHNFYHYYAELLEQDIYPQPEDVGHTILTQEVIDTIVKIADFASVLDVGCGEAFAQSMFNVHNILYEGVCLGDDYYLAHNDGKNVKEMDYNFLLYPDESFDLIFSRHSLEHSPFPIISLMEWHRVSRHLLCLIVPNPKHYTYLGRNHYSVAPLQQNRWWLRRAGWHIIWAETTDQEFRFLCEKKDRIGYEGWASNPVDYRVYEEDRG